MRGAAKTPGREPRRNAKRDWRSASTGRTGRTIAVARETVGHRPSNGERGDGGNKVSRKQEAGMRKEKKRRPKNRGADGEMVFEVAGGRPKVRFGLIAFVQTRPAETGVGGLVVLSEIETVLNQRSASESVITDTIAADPRVKKRKGEKKENDEQTLRSGRAARR